MPRKHPQVLGANLKCSESRGWATVSASQPDWRSPWRIRPCRWIAGRLYWGRLQDRLYLRRVGASTKRASRAPPSIECHSRFGRGRGNGTGPETSSLRLDVGGPDHLAPFLGFLGDQLAELDRRSRQRRAAEVGETGLHLRVVEGRIDLLVELVDDLGGCVPGNANAIPRRGLVARQEFSHSWDARQRLRARRRRNRKRAQSARVDILN